MVSAASYFLMLQKYINSKQKISEIKGYALCLGKKNFLKDFTINNMEKKKTGLKGVENFYLLIVMLLILMIF